MSLSPSIINGYGIDIGKYKNSQILIDLFSHSQRVYFKNHYYIKNADYPECQQ